MAEQIYKDFDFSFKSHPLSSDLSSSSGEAAIKIAIKNLLRLAPFDKPFNREISSPLYEVLFEPMDVATATLMKTNIKYLVEQYEPRISTLNVTVTPYPEDNKYQVDLSFTVKKSGSRESLQLFLPVERLR